MSSDNPFQSKILKIEREEVRRLSGGRFCVSFGNVSHVFDEVEPIHSNNSVIISLGGRVVGGVYLNGSFDRFLEFINEHK